MAKPGESVEVTIPLSVDELTVGERYHSVYRLKLPIDTHRPPRKFGDPLHIRVEVVATASDAEAAKAEEAEVAKPRKVSALSPPEGLDEEEETKDYDPPQAKKVRSAELSQFGRVYWFYWLVYFLACFFFRMSLFSTSPISSFLSYNFRRVY